MEGWCKVCHSMASRKKYQERTLLCGGDSSYTSLRRAGLSVQREAVVSIASHIHSVIYSCLYITIGRRQESYAMLKTFSGRPWDHLVSTSDILDGSPTVRRILVLTWTCRRLVSLNHREQQVHVRHVEQHRHR